MEKLEEAKKQSPLSAVPTLPHIDTKNPHIDTKKLCNENPDH